MKSKSLCLNGLLCLVLVLLSFSPAFAADPVIVFSEGFETPDPEWVFESVWEIGTPTSGPGSAHGGIGQCVATILGGNYPGETDSRLISPAMILPAVIGSEEVLLRFWQWSGSDIGVG